MAQKKQSEIITRLIAEVKAILLKLNTNTTTIKGKQGSLSQDQLNILGGNVFTTVEKTKLATAITEAVLNAKGYITTDAVNALLSGKQATLTQAQLTVLGGEAFTTALKNSLESLIAGGRYLGEYAVPDTWKIQEIITQLNTDYPAANAGDHIEVIQAGANAGDISYITYTKTTTSWSAGAAKSVHLKGGTIDAYTKAEANARFAPLADVSMDDADILALEAITITV